MKFTLALALGVLCIIAAVTARPAEEDYDYVEDEAPPPPPKPVARHNPVTGRRNPLSNRAQPTKATTTTTTTQSSKEEDISDEKLENEEGKENSTTEGPKKLTGTVRPFRSNDDLLAALKRRREQVANGKRHVNKASDNQDSSSAVAASPAEPKPSKVSAGRRRYSKPEPAASQQEPEASSAAPARTGRRFNSRS